MNPLLPIFAFALAVGLLASGPAVSQTATPLQLLLEVPEPSLLTYALIGRVTAVTPADVFEVEISESGGITDVFIRLAPAATAELAEWTTLGTGFDMTVHLCGSLVTDSVVGAPTTSGTFYIPNLDAVQAEALRAVWQGRATCSTLPPEVFPIGP